MNLVVLNKSHRGPKKGDIFVMLPPDNLFLYGRVISMEARLGPMKECVLIYIYNIRSSAKSPIPQLSRENLLIPPILTNKLPWRRGYFETVISKELTEMDQLEKHCFRSLGSGNYYDEFNNKLPGPVEPVGLRVLASFRSIDNKVSKSLGIPLSLDE